MEEKVVGTPKSIASSVQDVLKGFEKDKLEDKQEFPEYGKKGITKSPYKTQKSRAKEKARRKANKKRRRSKKN